MKWTLPNELSLIRIACAPVAFILAVWQQPNQFLLVLGLAFFLDAIDGPLARRLHQVSKLGSKLDSIADFLVYLAFAAGAALLWPEIIRQEMVFVVTIVMSIIMPTIVGLIRFHITTSYHTWLVKIAAVCTTVSGFLLFLGGPGWPFRISAIICALAALEEIVITLVIKQPRHDVKSLLHVIKYGNR
ncbi:MAG: CDP-alcohol phosphatidyltransferase family protein [Gammaproteobacteria bacterium]